MTKGDAPSAPDPYASAAAQYEYGTAAGNYNMGLNAVNSNTPYGSTTWTENPGGVASTPSNSQGQLASQAPTSAGGAPTTATAPTSYGTPTPYAPAGGSSIYSQAQAANGTPSAFNQNVATGEQTEANGTSTANGVPQLTPPQYTETQTLSPQEQALFNSTTSNQIGQANTAGALLPGAASAAESPLNLQTQVPGAGNQADEYNSAFNTALTGNMAAISPQLNSQEEQLDASLRNSGNLPGSPAYQTAMSQFTANEGGVLDQAAGAAENTGINLENTLYGQNLSSAQFGNTAAIEGQQVPLQNYMELAGGSATAPSGTAQPSSSVSTPDIMSAFNQQYQGELNAYNSSVGTQNSEMSDVGSLAAMAMLAYSDRRLKRDIERVGATASGLPLYRFRYLWDLASMPRRLGVMAQDLLWLRPAAVFEDRCGHLMVDYAQVT